MNLETLIEIVQKIGTQIIKKIITTEHLNNKRS